MTKILHVVPVDSRGQIPTFLAHQLNSLETKSRDSQILKFSGSEVSGKHFIQALGKMIRLMRTIRNFDGLIVHAHWGSILGYITSISVGRKFFVLTLRGSDVNFVKSEKKILSWIRVYLTRKAIMRAHHVIFVSARLRNKMLINSVPSSIIPDGTPLDIFHPKPQKNNIRSSNSERKQIVFYCGGRPIDKNLSLALEVYNKASLRFENLNFIIIENNMSQYEISNLLSISNVLLVTSLSEGSPNIVREAIASNCPVVSVDVGDAKFWIERCNAGVVCPYDSENLASSVIEVINDPPKIILSRTKEFSTETSALCISEVYKSLDSKC